MLFEDIMLLILLGSGVFLIGVPIYKLVRTVIPRKRNPLADAKERLEQARLEVEAARLDKEREKLYNKMYDEVLQDQEDTENQQQEKK